MILQTVGRDLAKGVFQVHGISENGQVIFNKAINGVCLDIPEIPALRCSDGNPADEANSCFENAPHKIQRLGWARSSLGTPEA
ncbi:hypothetical protein [Ruegeria conchae]|uniref:hypothetical protein n=1 Tax=Ruegeria conchae TaxID=981384 RepID=UPI0029C91E81|nr:hypothetical protein [Ruegeria conchae]